MHARRTPLPSFTTPSIDRWDVARSDPALLKAAFADVRARRLVLNGLDPVHHDAHLVREVLPAGVRVEDYVLLGREEDGAPLFVELRDDIPYGGAQTQSVRDAAAELAAIELSIYGGARSLLDWHARHGFCARCGGETVPVKGGWARKCDGCESEHFPRVDPVVIMLAEYEGRILVARQPRFPERRYSALAGFVEPGETVEGAVARELFEEAGIKVHDVRYVMSQPWPFPSSLMIACTALAEDDRITLDQTELEDALWVDAAGVRAALNGDADAPFDAPTPMAVARSLLIHWVETQN